VLNNQVVNLELTLNEVNSILNALGAMPYVQVVVLIDKLKTQVVPQVSQQETRG
jgi:hypothetical protein